MRLLEFIFRDMEPILAEWEAFTATHLPAATRMSSSALRDHAREILGAIILDLNTAQTPDEQDRKAKGGVPRPPDGTYTAAQTHAVMRAEAGRDRRRSNSHLGLGLFIAREIARAHGGNIHASSDEHGTSFTLHLPRSI